MARESALTGSTGFYSLGSAADQRLAPGTNKKIGEQDGAFGNIQREKVDSGASTTTVE
jgi:hypothetical protein